MCQLSCDYTQQKRVGFKSQSMYSSCAVQYALYPQRLATKLIQQISDIFLLLYLFCPMSHILSTSPVPCLHIRLIAKMVVSWRCTSDSKNRTYLSMNWPFALSAGQHAHEALTFLPGSGLVVCLCMYVPPERRPTPSSRCTYVHPHSVCKSLGSDTHGGATNYGLFWIYSVAFICYGW